MRSLLVRIVLSLALLWLPGTAAFAVKPSFGRTPAFPTTTDRTARLGVTGGALHAKKRRRRKESSSKSSDETGDDDLPDFDLKEEEAPSSGQKAGNPPPTITTSADGAAITAAMMGSSNSPSNRSVRDLLSDRSLEDKVSFDDEEAIASAAEELPDLIQMGRQARGLAVETSPTGAGGKKQARRVQRQAAAEAKQAQEEDANPLITFLADVSFLQDDEGKVTGVKILEAGTWAGIYLLVAWEFYINSPLFDRAAPLSPVVY